mmetsp:Transcript_31479/g.75953  ORF Transcript_31479/g.75953 Transcript_31479/m.75953 type:complete len:940 (-) Transcript_31479:221-3040(-)
MMKFYRSRSERSKEKQETAPDGTAMTQTDELSASLAEEETRWVNFLRVAVIRVLLLTGILLSTGVYVYTRNEEQVAFSEHVSSSAHQVLTSFEATVERTIEAVGDQSTSYTSYALDKNLTFPNVTLPHFALKGSHSRTLSGSHIIHYMPVITDETRDSWEAYASENRYQINEASEQDKHFRSKQDAALALSRSDSKRLLQTDEPRNTTIMRDDGSNFHPKIWNNGGVDAGKRGDEPPGVGSYLPMWQRSPINDPPQRLLNLDFAATKVIGKGLIDLMQQDKEAVLRGAAMPNPKFRKAFESNLRISQYRENVDDFVGGMNTYLTYPVFDSFEDDKNVVGVLATNLHWTVLFSNLLPESALGMICVITNTKDQTFTYRIDGCESRYLGLGDLHDPRFDEFEVKEQVNEVLKGRFRAQNTAYDTVPLSDTMQYTMRVYPSEDTEFGFITNQPVLYTSLIACIFIFTAVIFLLFAHHVEKRQRLMLQTVVENANRVAAAERELNEFLSHEIRNPLSAALSATSFLSEAINEHEPLSNEEGRNCTREDITVVNSSLSFINDFLRSMLDIHKLNGNHLVIEKKPTDVLHDILEPVSAILYQRVADFEVVLECPEGLLMQTDSLRLKQVVLNLARNSSKFVVNGFVRLRAAVVENQVMIYIEDSGTGVPKEKQANLFEKYQTSLDMLSQGTGLGLSLSKKLMTSLGGEIYLDGSYHSGVDGYPGACFVLQMNTSPLDIESALPPAELSMEFISVTLNERDAMQQQTKECAIYRPEAEQSLQKSELQSSSRNALQGSSDANQIENKLPNEYSVLFVDDDAVLRKLFVRGLKRLKPEWQIKEASSGEMALKTLEGYKADLIFLDQYMASTEKQMLGTETASAMRSRGITSIICGLSANDMRDSFISAGADGFILKPMPCKPQDLQKALLALLEQNASMQRDTGVESV